MQQNEVVRNRPMLMLVSLLALAALTTSGCAERIPGSARQSTTLLLDHVQRGTTSLVPSDFVRGSDGGEIDTLAATVITEVRAFWRREYPSVFGEPWRELEGGFVSVDTADAGAPPPPCTQSASDVEGNAYYCPAEDVIVWDRAALLPVLTERYGAGAVMLVLAHEIGHAVQARAGVTGRSGRADPRLYPTIVLESMADCYAGAFLRWVVDGDSGHLRLAEDELDAALRALITFRDPIGTDNSEQGAHGDAFDRVSAFQDGYQAGTGPCSRITAENRTFTQRAFTSAGDLERGGNLPLQDLLAAMTEDLDAYFTGIVGTTGAPWSPPELGEVPTEPRCTRGGQGGIAYCPDAKAVRVHTEGMLGEVHAGIGDYAAGTLLASRYALGAWQATGHPLTGRKAQRGALCLAGAYTGSLLRPQRDFTVSPGDLGEAVQLLLLYDYPARDVDGGSLTTGFARIAAFRAGVTAGAGGCGLG
ncbi:neutral zinc metallopeptidase [Amycolatopsis cihanbeyliensis]|uniref:Putative neutral zinc metallopeptidase n=1 Tax=Amycolatopsis cihanbeyliensis TaxID=1128664 RepID=A0A542CUM3_AMYCI|nr:neutral zinc metallopeptidase [Amycolatopsis cihanbeyliensis]TQI94525.1 putative neutral zinc metallopeptidase [Amycolatopsis cihanbeyliensis]